MSAERIFLEAVLAKMRPTLLRSIGSLALVDTNQIACALTDREGRVAATDNPRRLGTLQSTCDAMLSYFGDDLEVGDVVVTNDPFSGGTRIQDLTALLPIEHGGQRAGHAMIVAPLPDLGGTALGGTHPYALEIWAEGVRVTPTKLWRKGNRQADALTMLTLNSRLAQLVEHDTEAMRAALGVAQDMLRGDAPTSTKLAECMAGAIAQSENAFRERLRELPAGEFSAPRESLHQCQDASALEVALTLCLGGKDLRLDFSGSSPQSSGFVNATAATTRAAAVASLLAALELELLPNAGVLDCVTLDIPDDCFLNAKLPVSVGWSVYGPALAVERGVASALRSAGVTCTPPTAPYRNLPFRIQGCGRPDCPFVGETA